MAASRDIRDHYVRCQPHLAELQVLARHQGGEPLPHGATEEVAQATRAVLAEAHAAGRVTVTAVASSQRRAVTAFVDARLARLAVAAEESVAAAKGGDAAALGRLLRRFEVLTWAMCTVQLAVYAEGAGLAPEPQPQLPARPVRIPPARDLGRLPTGS
jgi:hypothetical protein